MPLVPAHGGVAHIPVPGPLLAEYGVNAFVAHFIQGIELVQIGDAAYHHAVGVWERFGNLAYPFFCDVRGAHDEAEGFFARIALMLPCPQPVQRAEGRGADLRLPTTALRLDDGALADGQLALDRFSNGELGIVERVARVILNELVDGEDFIAQRLRRRVKQRLKLGADALGYGHAEGVQVVRDALDLLKTVRCPGHTSRYADRAGFEAVLQNLHHVLVLRGQVQHPRLQLFRQRQHLHLPQESAGNEFVDDVVPIGGDEGSRRFPVQLVKQPVLVASRDEDVAGAGLLFLFVAVPGDSGLIVGFVVVVGDLHVIFYHHGDGGVDALMGELPVIGFGLALHELRLPPNGGLDCRAAVHGVGQPAHHFRISAEADSGDHAFSILRALKDDGVGITRKTYLRLIVVILQMDQLALCHLMVSLLYCVFLAARSRSGSQSDFIPVLGHFIEGDRCVECQPIGSLAHQPLGNGAATDVFHF